MFSESRIALPKFAKTNIIHGYVNKKEYFLFILLQTSTNKRCLIGKLNYYYTQRCHLKGKHFSTGFGLYFLVKALQKASHPGWEMNQ